MRLGRFIRTLLVFVLLGTVATVLSSWAIHAVQAWRVSRGLQPVDDWDTVQLPDTPFWNGREQASPDAWSPHRQQPIDAAWSNPNVVEFSQPRRLSAWGWRVYTQRLTTARFGAGPHVATYEGLGMLQSGFPIPSIQHSTYAGTFGDRQAVQAHTLTPPISLHGGVQFIPWVHGSSRSASRPPNPHNPFDRFALPLLPVWPGFFINTAFYALLLCIAWR